MNNLPQHPDDLRDECRRVGDYGPAMAAYPTLWMFYQSEKKLRKDAEQRVEDRDKLIVAAAGVTT